MYFCLYFAYLKGYNINELRRECVLDTLRLLFGFLTTSNIRKKSTYELYLVVSHISKFNYSLYLMSFLR